MECMNAEEQAEVLMGMTLAVTLFPTKFPMLVGNVNTLALTTAAVSLKKKIIAKEKSGLLTLMGLLAHLL